MSFLIKYHKLFEVRIIHAFYLREEAAFYGMTESEKAIELLETNYNILNDLEIIPTKSCQKKLDGHKLRFKASSLGFMVGIETTDTGAGSIKPSIPISEGTVFHFRIKVKNTNWTNYTNTRLKPSVNANFYFSNVDNQVDLQNTTDTIRPALSLQAPNHNPNRNYEMGEMVKDGTTVYRAKRNMGGSFAPPSNSWENLGNALHVSSGNRMLLPSRFSYIMLPNPGVNITELTCDLLLPDNTVVTSLTVPVSAGNTSVFLDFRGFENGRVVDVPPGQYTFEVSSPEGYQESLRIRIDDELYNFNDWGVIAIAHQGNLPKPEYRILENNGNLRIESGAPKNPVFEIRLKNRATYWRYIFHPANKGLPPLGSDFSNYENTILTKNAFPLSNFYKDHNLQINSKNLPNPTNLLVKQDKDKIKYFSEIYLQKMNF